MHRSVGKKKVLKKVDNLYVSADEDHVSLQFFEKKGDITVNKNGLKYNSCLSKLVYVYEGRVPERPVSGSEKPRWKLKNAKYFSGVYEGSKNRIAKRDGLFSKKREKP